jgi:hypothetical protein
MASVNLVGSHGRQYALLNTPEALVLETIVFQSSNVGTTMGDFETLRCVECNDVEGDIFSEF